jgi:hypothetical protein
MKIAAPDEKVTPFALMSSIASSASHRSRSTTDEPV